jgi:hypothetical protein
MRTLALLLCLATVTAAHAQQTCLDMADATGTHFTSDRTMVVRTRYQQVFQVTFRSACSVAVFPRTHFIYEPWTLRPCLRKGHTLDTNGRGPCIVDTVSKVSSPDNG